MVTTKNVDRSKLSDMFAQYVADKDKYPNDILVYRVGDFFEAYFEDALLFSNLGGIRLTGKTIGSKSKKSKSKDEENIEEDLTEDKKFTAEEIQKSNLFIPMAGVPHRNFKGYAYALVKEGHRVVVAEQLEDPKTVKGKRLVNRGVVKILSAMDIDEGFLDEGVNNYLCGIYYENGLYGLCFTDIGTDETFITYVKSLREVLNELFRYKPNEVLLTQEIKDLIGEQIIQRIKIHPMITVEECAFDMYGYVDKILSTFNITDIEDIKYHNSVELKALCTVINYINYTQKLSFSFSKLPISYISEHYLEIDSDSRVNLELCENLKDGTKTNTLLSVLDDCKTSMGKRLLKQWIDKPLQYKDEINKRLNAVSELSSDVKMLQEVQESLFGVLDISRIIGRLKLGKVTPRDLVNLRESLKLVPKVRDYLGGFNAVYLKELFEKMDVCDEFVDLLEAALVDNPMGDIQDNTIIRSSYNEELAKARDMLENANKYMTEFEEKEKERTGIKNLKIVNKNNKYCIVVTKTNLNKVPKDYILVDQTKKDYKYDVEGLDKLESDIITSRERSKSIEIKLYNELKEAILFEADKILTLCDILAAFDVLSSFASVALKNKYTKPEINTKGEINIVEGRHPVVEKLSDSEFVTNDFKMTNDGKNFYLITGPNMAGKSTYMRQAALITIMAHIGSFVPATYADICIVDKIFTRIGASDDISSGRSTYMVEMTEVKNILENATKKSFVLLDEVGRGTSTMDGLSIAQAVTEYIIKKIGCKTLFATHYHELITLEDSLPELVNYHMSVERTEQGLKFLRKIEEGGLAKSYGIDVAELAGLSSEIIDRAKEIYKVLEGKELNVEVKEETLETQVLDKLKAINKSNLTPILSFKYLSEVLNMLE